MENDRLKEAENSLKFWQGKLNMGNWSMSIKLVDFNRTDYIQTGDFKVKSDKNAVILISKSPTDKDIDKVVLHELIHILLWKMDSYCEQKIGLKNHKEYFELLETTVDDLANRIYLSCGR